jgi:hypothetical protein
LQLHVSTRVNPTHPEAVQVCIKRKRKAMYVILQQKIDILLLLLGFNVEVMCMADVCEQHIKCYRLDN